MLTSCKSHFIHTRFIVIDLHTVQVSFLLLTYLSVSCRAEQTDFSIIIMPDTIPTLCLCANTCPYILLICSNIPKYNQYALYD